MLRHGAADALCHGVNYCSAFMTRAGPGSQAVPSTSSNPMFDVFSLDAVFGRTVL